MWKNVSQFFLSPPLYVHGFSTLVNSNKCFNKSFAFLMWILLKIVISIASYSENNWTKVHYWHMCEQISRFPGWPCSHRRRRAIDEVNLRWKRLLTAFLLAFSANYFLISWQKPTRFFTTTVQYFLEYFKFFHGLNFQWSKSLQNFCSLLKICENHESFFIMKLLLFTI